MSRSRLFVVGALSALTADEEGGNANGVDWLLRNHRELIDAVTPWIAQQSGGEVQLGIGATRALASFGWMGIRGMSWFLFGRDAISRRTGDHPSSCCTRTTTCCGGWSTPTGARTGRCTAET